MQRRWMGLIDRAQQTAAAAGDAKILRHEEKASPVVSPASSRGLEEHLPSFLSLQGEAERFLATQSRLDHKELTAMELYLNKELPLPTVLRLHPLSPAEVASPVSRIA